MKKLKILEKLPDESRVYGFDFSLQPEIVAGNTLVSAVISATPPGLTIGSAGIAGAIADATISGGTPGVTYLVNCDAVTNLAAILGMLGHLLVIDPSTL